MEISSTLHRFSLIILYNILPLVLALIAIIWISKRQSLSKRAKIIVSIIILLCIYIIRNWQINNYETTMMLYAIFILVRDIGQIVLFVLGIRWIIKTTSINKTLKIILIISISVCACIMLSNYSDEIMDETYIEMNELVENESLIGLSEDAVVELLGEPEAKSTYKKQEKNYTNYRYSMGKVREEWFWGRCYTTKYYRLNIICNEDGIVESVNIQDITD